MAWLRELLAQPVNDYPQFAAALAFFAALDKDEVVRLLKVRIALLGGQAAGEEKQLKNFIELGLPRLFLVEVEYALAMKRAEVDWVRKLIVDIDGGRALAQRGVGLHRSGAFGRGATDPVSPAPDRDGFRFGVVDAWQLSYR